MQSTIKSCTHILMPHGTDKKKKNVFLITNYSCSVQDYINFNKR